MKHNLVSIESFEGLTKCTVCGAAEGELLSFCPGYELNYETKEACYSGNVIDFNYRKPYVKRTGKYKRSSRRG